MTLVPYLFFNGNCREALAFYAGIFGSESEIMNADAMPEEYTVPEEKKNWVMHSMMKVGDSMLMASDNLMGESGTMQGCSIMASFPDLAEARAIFDRLAEGGEVTMPWGPTFWSTGFGTLTDRFGTRWMIGCDEAPQG